MLVLPMAAFACSAPLRLQLELSRDDLQKQLAPSFPIAQDLMVASVELAEPAVLLAEGSDRIGVRFVAAVRVALVEVRGAVAVEGGLRFAPNEGTFYLRDPAIVEISVPGLSEQQATSVRAIINDALLPMLPEVPLYTLEEGATKMLLRSVIVRDGKVVVELGV